MPPVSTNDLKNGMTLLLDKNLMQVVEFQHVKPGKGHAFVRSKLKNVRTGAVAVDGLHVQQVGHPVELVQIRIHDRHSVTLGGQHLRQVGADLTEADDQDVHGRP